jgi:hypothetical protein
LLERQWGSRSFAGLEIQSQLDRPIIAENS